MIESALSGGDATAPGRRVYWVWMSVIACVLAFYASRGTLRFPFSADPLRARDSAYHNVYALLVEGFLSGQLGMALQPAPALVAADDPYDLVKHQRYYPYDVSYYKGTFYTYYGVAPALTLFLPVRVLLGVHVPLNFAAWLFAVVTIGVTLWLVWRIMREQLPGAPRGYYHAAALALAFSIPIPYEMTSAAFYEVAIFSCQAWLSMGLLAWYVADVRQQPRWYVALCACLVMAAASRPPAAVVAGAVLCYMAVQWRRLGWRVVAAGALVLALGAAGLMWYNYARFGSVFEFGLHYVPSWFKPVLYPRAVFIDTVRLNAWMYLLQPWQAVAHFPYVRVYAAMPAWYPAPDKYFTMENTIGVLLGTPYAIPAIGLGMGSAAWRYWKRQSVAAQPALACALRAIGVAAIMFALLLPVPATTMRYMLDFLLMMAVAACVCAAWIDQGVIQSYCGRWLWRSVLGGTLIYAVGLHVLLGFQGHWDAFRRYNPWLFSSLQRSAPRLDERWPVRQVFSNLYPSGALQTRIEMIADTNGMHTLRHGWFEEWYSDGTLKQRGRYRRGQPEGRWTWWHHNGARAMEGTFRHGTHHGWWYYWNTNGALTREVFVLEGVTIKEISYE